MSQPLPKMPSPEDNPVLRSLREAPLDDEPETDEERAAVEEAKREYREGKGISTEQLVKELGLEL
ncbi:MAG: hypothetical protein HY744_28205 [Deltaproteobacteria bacterium]|nr:hypothetical protein [Deltaproteobacteria bacterium]